MIQEMKRIVFLGLFLLVSLHAYSGPNYSKNYLEPGQEHEDMLMPGCRATGSTIDSLDNRLFFMPNGEYYFNIDQKYNAIGKSFFEGIIGGNIFVLFNWAERLRIEKNSESIRVSFDEPSFHESEVLRELTNVFSNWAIYISALISNSIVINYEKNVSIDYQIDREMLYIHRISGVGINHKFSIGDQLFSLLDVKRYKLLYRDNCIFFGVSSNDGTQSFDYYVYTSTEDILDRGFNDVLNHSNQEIRENLRPFVINFF